MLKSELKKLPLQAHGVRVISISTVLLVSCMLAGLTVFGEGGSASTVAIDSDPPPERRPVENNLRPAPPATLPSPIVPTLPASPPTTPTNDLDPDLGRLRLRQLAAPSPPPAPALYLLGEIGYFRSSNIFAGIDPVDDGLVFSRVTLLAVPSLGSDTSLIASVAGGLVRYDTRYQVDYNEFRTYLGISHRLFDNTYGEVGWRNQQLFDRARGDRFLSDQALYLALSRRDFLSPQLTLETAYQFRYSLADPDSRSQSIHSLSASLGYGFQPDLHLDLSYQLALASFTQQTRDDTYHQVALRLSYGTLTTGRLSLFVGQSFGASSNPTINFNGLIMGVSADIGLAF